MRRLMRAQRNRNVVLAFGCVGAIALSGCASNPSAALPDVQRRVGTTMDLALAWPTDATSRKASDEAVARLLAQPLTPDIAVRVAVLNSRALRATLEEVGVSEADLMQSGLLHNPIFFADARFPNRAPHPADVELSLAADVLDDLLIPVRKRAAKAQLEMTEDRVAQTVLDLAAEVKIAAYTLQAREAFRARLERIAATDAVAVDLARRQFDAGNISRLDLANQEAAAQEARFEIMQTDAQIESDREALNRLMSLSEGQVHWTLEGDLPPLPVSDAIPADLEQAALKSRYDLAAARAQADLARTTTELVRKTRFLPAGVKLGVDSERNPDGSRVTGPSVEVGLPVFDQGQARLAKAEAEQRQAEDRYDALAAEIGSQVRAANAALSASRAAVDYYDKTILPQRELIVRQTLLNYNAMQSSPYDLLLAKEAELAAERQAVEAARDYWTARVRLERAVGGRL